MDLQHIFIAAFYSTAVLQMILYFAFSINWVSLSQSNYIVLVQLLHCC